MHELLLHAPVPLSQHPQLLSILAGLSAMQPVPVLEKHLLFRPNRRPTVKAVKVGGSQTIAAEKRKKEGAEEELWYMTVVGRTAEETGQTIEKHVKEHPDVTLTAVDLIEEGGINADVGGGQNGRGGKEVKEDGEKVNWTLQFRDLPDPDRSRQVTCRSVSDVPILEGDPVEAMEGMDYSLVTSFYLHGHRFTYQNTSLLLHRIFVPPQTTNHTEFRNNAVSSEKGTHLGKLLDPSSAYMLQASLRAQDGGNLELMKRGVSELQRLQETLKGVVELKEAERLSMDTRYR